MLALGPLGMLQTTSGFKHIGQHTVIENDSAWDMGELMIFEDAETHDGENGRCNRETSQFLATAERPMIPKEDIIGGALCEIMHESVALHENIYVY